MSQEKPKYIRKRCEHEKYAFQCKDCKGSCICIHGKQKSICKECGGSMICIHERNKNNCKECHGVSICEHNKRRSRCKVCKGGSICSHNKLKSRCAVCGGNELCEHKKRQEYCTKCQGNQICSHQLRRSRCKECNGPEICSHGNNKYNCIPCDGINVCEHNKLQYQCTECKGRLTCEHGKRKATCADCDGSYICSHEQQKNKCIQCNPENACQHCKSISIIGSRWQPYCFRCYCVLHPDADIPRKYKLKEHLVRDKLIEEFKDSITMRFDKIVEGGCSRKRPDISIDFGSHCLMIEIDEHQHMNYECEQRRMQELYEDIGFRKIVFLRFNPDGYHEGSTTFSSPFGYSAAGAICIKTDEFNRRIHILLDRIHIHQKVEPVEQLTVEYLFYSI
jgi:hypothetical protein